MKIFGRHRYKFFITILILFILAMLFYGNYNLKEGFELDKQPDEMKLKIMKFRNSQDGVNSMVRTGIAPIPTERSTLIDDEYVVNEGCEINNSRFASTPKLATAKGRLQQRNTMNNAERMRIKLMAHNYQCDPESYEEIIIE